MIDAKVSAPYRLQRAHLAIGFRGIPVTSVLLPNEWNSSVLPQRLGLLSPPLPTLFLNACIWTSNCKVPRSNRARISRFCGCYAMLCSLGDRESQTRTSFATASGESFIPVSCTTIQNLSTNRNISWMSPALKITQFYTVQPAVFQILQEVGTWCKTPYALVGIYCIAPK